MPSSSFISALRSASLTDMSLVICVRVSVRVRVRSVCVFERACMRKRARARVFACVRACLRAPARTRVRAIAHLAVEHAVLAHVPREILRALEARQLVLRPAGSRGTHEYPRCGLGRPLGSMDGADLLVLQRALLRTELRERRL